MFCPHIKGRCRTDCAKWDKSLSKCSDEIMLRAYMKAQELSGAYEYLLQLGKITWRLQIKSLMEDPMVPNDIKEAIKEVKNAEALEKLLEDAGLLD